MTSSQINYIQGTDKKFTIVVRFKSSSEPKDLSGFVAATGDGLQLFLPAGSGPAIALNLDDSADGKLEVESVSAGLAGKIKVTLKDAINLKVKDRQDIELKISEGAGPDYDISIVQFPGKLSVKNKIF